MFRFFQGADDLLSQEGIPTFFGMMTYAVSTYAFAQRGEKRKERF